MKETYIFRFRDLGKSEGFTIEQQVMTPTY